MQVTLCGRNEEGKQAIDDFPGASDDEGGQLWLGLGISSACSHTNAM